MTHTTNLRKVVTGPPVWSGDDLAVRSDWIYHLSERDLAEIDKAVKGISVEIPK